MAIILNNTSFILSNFSFISFDGYAVTQSSSGIVTSGSVFLAMASNITSYPGTGTAWYDISGNSNTGSLINGPVYNGSSSFVFDGTNDSATFNSGSAINDL